MSNPNFSAVYSTNNIWRDTDMERCLTDDLDAIDMDIAALETGKADSNHTHNGYASASDVTALQTLVGDTSVSSQISTAVSGKADTNHTHAIANITGLSDELDSKYEKASTGIPKTDLTADVQVSLGKADTAIQSLSGYATETYVNTQLASLIDSAPETLNTLDELANALGDDPNFATTIANQIGTKVTAVEGKGLSTNDLTDSLKTNYDAAYAHVIATNNPHGVSLSQLGINASAAELNYVDGVTSNIQTQLNGKAATHSHPYLSSSGGTTTGAIKANGGFNVPNNTAVRSYDTSGKLCELVYLSDNNNVIVGAGDTTGHSGDTKVYSQNGNISLTNKNNVLSWYAFDGSDNYSSILRCTTDCGATCGSSSYRWYRLYAASSTVLTSDEREKSNIEVIDDDVFEQLFAKLTPKTYTLNIEDTDELHIGFIAQDVDKSLEELGLSEGDLGLINHEYWTDEETGEEKDRYGLAYEEFTVLNTHIIQKQQAKIELLEERIAKLEKLIENK